MIVEKISGLYEHDERRKASTGYPTGSRLGTCAAQLAMLRYPALTKPEVPQPRQIMTWDEGNRTEAWLAERLERAFPDMVGLRQEPMYGRVPLPEGWMVDELRRQIARRKGSPDGPNLWGTEYDERPFVPPSIRVDGAGRVKLRLLPCGSKCAGTDHAWGCKKKSGFILDPKCADGPSVWVPTYLDFVVLHDTLGLVVVEAKSMSDFSFRRTLLGELDYGKRCQLAWMVEATGAPVVLIAYRKNTSHLAEVAYTQKADRVRVLIAKMNGQQEAFLVDQGQLRVEATGEAAEIPADVLWERAEVWTPYDPAILAEIRARVLRVLFAKPGGWFREYGPDFTCSTCAGTGMQTLAKTGARDPLKGGPKPCEDCGGVAGRKAKKGKGGEADEPETVAAPGCGFLERVLLPSFPCGYCATMATCWEAAGLETEITDKPRHYVSRTAYLASGLTFVPPEDPRAAATANPVVAAEEAP